MRTTRDGSGLRIHQSATDDVMRVTVQPER